MTKEQFLGKVNELEEEAKRASNREDDLLPFLNELLEIHKADEAGFIENEHFLEDEPKIRKLLLSQSYNDLKEGKRELFFLIQAMRNRGH